MGSIDEEFALPTYIPLEDDYDERSPEFTIYDGTPQATIEESLDRKELVLRIKEALGTIDEREAAIIAMRFGLDDGNQKTYYKIGKELGIGIGEIRQIKAKAMSKLRHPSRSMALSSFLDD
jgi:RNA polymerase sigma factor (sigma-70 family)